MAESHQQLPRVGDARPPPGMGVSASEAALLGVGVGLGVGVFRDGAGGSYHDLYPSPGGHLGPAREDLFGVGGGAPSAAREELFVKRDRDETAAVAAAVAGGADGDEAAEGGS